MPGNRPSTGKGKYLPDAVADLGVWRPKGRHKKGPSVVDALVFFF